MVPQVMGGFYSSKEIEKLRDLYPDYEVSYDQVEEALEQCAAMTRVFETGDYDSFLDFCKTFTGKYPAVARMLRPSNFSSDSDEVAPDEEIITLDCAPVDLEDDPRVKAAMVKHLLDALRLQNER